MIYTYTELSKKISYKIKNYKEVNFYDLKRE